MCNSRQMQQEAVQQGVSQTGLASDCHWSLQPSTCGWCTILSCIPLLQGLLLPVLTMIFLYCSCCTCDAVMLPVGSKVLCRRRSVVASTNW
jgi:hypothetical protein